MRTTFFSEMSGRLMRLLVTALAITSVLFVCIPPANASIFGARVNARVLFNALRAAGWTVRDEFSVGLLARGDSAIIRTTLHAGNVYKIAAAGCEDAFDVDIAVFDENGNPIDGDEDFEKLAVADIIPAWTGTYYIKVSMANSTPDGAHYVVQYAFRKR